MPTQYRCGNENRLALVRTTKDSNDLPLLNGMDYLEVVSADERTLEVHFIHPLPGQGGGVPASSALTEKNFVIQGGVRLQGIKIITAVAAAEVITLTVNEAGDYSAYILKLVGGEASDQPPS